jgi:hypothetical protein
MLVWDLFWRVMVTVMVATVIIELLLRFGERRQSKGA